MGLNDRSTTTINIYAPWNVDINAMCEHIHHAQPLAKERTYIRELENKVAPDLHLN